MKKAFRAVGTALRVLVLVLAGLLLLYNIYTLVARYAFGEGIPTLFGYGFAVVETGSMEPEIAAGDFVVLHAEEEYAVGDVITFYDSERGEYVTHRIVLVSEGGYTTKGDANNWQDSFTVPQDAVVGKVTAVLHGFGSFIAFVQTPLGILVIIAAAAAVWVATALVGRALGKRREAAETAKAGAENTEQASEKENTGKTQGDAADAAAEAEECAAGGPAAEERAAERGTDTDGINERGADKYGTGERGADERGTDERGAADGEEEKD